LANEVFLSALQGKRTLHMMYSTRFFFRNKGKLRPLQIHSKMYSVQDMGLLALATKNPAEIVMVDGDKKKVFPLDLFVVSD